MLNLRLNRKAIFQDWIPLFVFLVVMVFIIVYFISYQSGKEIKMQNKFLENKEEIDAYQALNSYLRLYSDLIILRINDISFENELKRKTEDYFNKINKKGWRLRINFEINYEPLETKLRYSKFIKVEIPYFNKNIEVAYYYE